MYNLDTLSDRLATYDSQRQEFNTLAYWHYKAYVLAGVEMPYRGDDKYRNLTVYEWDDEENKYAINHDKTLDALKRITRFAVEEGCEIKKDYSSSDFDLKITLPEGITLTYYASRDVVCTARVVGTKFTPAKMIPPLREDIIEWDCEAVALLAP